MKLSSLLKKDRINLSLTSETKEDVLRELVSMIKKGEVQDVLFSSLIKREQLGSTGIGKGIAIPHCRSLVVNKLEIAIGRSEKGVDFDAVDNKPVHLFFLIVAPPQDKGNQYLITLGKVAMLAQEMIKNKLIFKPSTPEEFIKLVKELENKGKL